MHWWTSIAYQRAMPGGARDASPERTPLEPPGRRDLGLYRRIASAEILQVMRRVLTSSDDACSTMIPDGPVHPDPCCAVVIDPTPEP